MWTLAATLLLLGVAIGALPQWGHMQKHDLGWFPSAMALVLLIVMAILLLAGVIR